MAAREENTADGRLTDSLKTEIILAFKDFPSLWNTSLAIYKDKQKKTEDTQVLASRFRMPVDELKKLLHSLRTSMTREIKRMRENKGFVSRWKFFKDMEYLKDEIVKSIDEKQGKEWDDMEVETLIDFYKQHTFLWDHHTEQYKDRNLRDVTLNKLLDMLSGRTIEDIKSQWHSLKTIFDRENKREEGSKRTGTGTDSVYKPAWKYYDSMQFTKECQDIDYSVSTLDSVQNENNVPSPEQCRKKRKKESNQMAAMAEARMEFFQQAVNVLKGPEEQRSEEDKDPRPCMKEITAFGQVVQETLARFTPMQRVHAKKRINDVLYEVEIGFNMNNGNMSQPQMVSPVQSQQGYMPPFSYTHTESPVLYPPSHARSASPASSASSSDGQRSLNAQLSPHFFGGLEYEHD